MTPNAPPPHSEDPDSDDRIPLDVALTEAQIALIDALPPDAVEKMILGFLREQQEHLLRP